MDHSSSSLQASTRCRPDRQQQQQQQQKERHSSCTTASSTIEGADDDDEEVLTNTSDHECPINDLSARHLSVIALPNRRGDAVLCKNIQEIQERMARLSAQDLPALPFDEVAVVDTNMDRDDEHEEVYEYIEVSDNEGYQGDGDQYDYYCDDAAEHDDTHDNGISSNNNSNNNSNWDGEEHEYYDGDDGDCSSYIEEIVTCAAGAATAARAATPIPSAESMMKSNDDEYTYESLAETDGFDVHATFPPTFFSPKTRCSVNGGTTPTNGSAPVCAVCKTTPRSQYTFVSLNTASDVETDTELSFTPKSDTNDDAVSRASEASDSVEICIRKYKPRPSFDREEDARVLRVLPADILPWEYLIDTPCKVASSSSSPPPRSSPFGVKDAFPSMPLLAHTSS